MVKKAEKKNEQDSYEYFKDLTNEQLTQEYRRIGEVSLLREKELYHSLDGWKACAGHRNNLKSGFVEYKKFTEDRKTFKLKGYIDLPPHALFRFFQDGIETAVTWDKTLQEAKVLERIGSDIDVTYHIANGYGLIHSREFVNLRHWKKEDGVIFMSCVGTEHPDYPPGSSKHVRAWNNSGGYVIEDVPEEPNKCLFIWFANIDFRGWLPQVAIDHSLPSFLLDHLRELRAEIERVKSLGKY